jgi:hypothetical protein
MGVRAPATITTSVGNMNIFSPDKLCSQIKTGNFHAKHKMGAIPSEARKLLFDYGFGIRRDLPRETFLFLLFRISASHNRW